jgi:hypothetical protein
MIAKQMSHNRFSGRRWLPGLLFSMSDIAKMNHNRSKTMELTAVLTPLKKAAMLP